MNLLISLAALLQGTETQEQAKQPPPSLFSADMFVMLGGVILIFYLIAWRPQAKERRHREAMLGALKKGDKVVTNSGMYGTVDKATDTEVVLKVDEKNNVKLRFSRGSVQTVLGDPDQKAEPAK